MTSFIGALFFGGHCFENWRDIGLERRSVMMKWLKRIVVTGLVLTIVTVLVPSYRAWEYMIAASIVTPDNIAGAENHAIDLIQRIVEAINQARGF